MIRCAISALIALLLAQPTAAWAGPDGVPPAACPDSAEFETPDQPLDALATAIKLGQPIEVLALGSASMVALGKDSFPYHTVQGLAAALPRIGFRLTVLASRGRTAEAMLADLDAALKRQRFPLVLWQSGTVEAVRGIRPEELRLVLEDGADRVHSQGGNLILIDPQFSRFLRANTDIEPYQRAMAAAAELPGADLFNRFDLMHAWASDGSLDLEHTPPPEQPAAMAMLSRCLGRALARFVLNGIGR